jgi:hypothetical protein
MVEEETRMGTDEAAPVSAAESLRLIRSQRDAKPARATQPSQPRPVNRPFICLPESWWSLDGPSEDWKIHTMRTRIAAIAAAVLLTGAALATASPAWASDPGGGAAWDHIWTTVDADQGGTVYIEEHGDVVELCDTAADGYAPRLEVFTQASNGQYTPRYDLTASGGFATCVTRSASNGGIYDLPENDNISVAIWLGPNAGFDGSQHYYLNDN